jgi:hypothetical protein
VQNTQLAVPVCRARAQCSYLQSRFPGTSPQEAANILAIVNVVGTVMRLFVGFLTGCVNSFLLFAVALGVQTALWVVMFIAINSVALSLWEFAAVCVACKICYGAGFTLVNLLVDQVFGAKNGTQVYVVVFVGVCFLVVLLSCIRTQGTRTGRSC